MTRIGGALRKTHLDEVPQLWNVLRGDMAIVGPRPIRPAFFAELCREIPQYWQRLVVRPGVTGFAQTRMTREESWADKLAHDMEYIADRSVRLYVSVLLATVAKVLGRARRHPTAETGGPRLRDCRAMCGICGVVAAERDAAPTSRRWRRMNGRLVHRGPDSEGLFCDGAGRRWRCAGSRSSTSRTATSRSPTRTAASSSSRTARSTTTAS